MGHSKKKRKTNQPVISIGHLTRSNMDISLAAKVDSARHQNMDVAKSNNKNEPKLVTLKCLRNKCSVGIENMDYILKGRQNILLSELPSEWWSVDETFEFEYLPGVAMHHQENISDCNNENLGLKIVETFSLAKVNTGNEQVSPIPRSGESTNEETALPAFDEKEELPTPYTFSHNDLQYKFINGSGRLAESYEKRMPSCSDMRQEDFSNHQRPFVRPARNATSTDTSKVADNDLKSVFCCPLLDSLLETEAKTIETQAVLQTEQLADYVSTIKYNTPVSQANYIKTLATALEERDHRPGTIFAGTNGKGNQSLSIRPKKTSVVKPTFNLTKIRKSLQGSTGSKIRRGNAINAILSGLPNILCQNRSRNRTAVDRRKSMLQNITLRMADTAMTALKMVENSFDFSVNNEMLYDDPKTVKSAATQSSLQMQSYDCQKSDIDNEVHCFPEKEDCHLKRTVANLKLALIPVKRPMSLPVHNDSKRRKINSNVFDNLLQHISHKKAEQAVSALLSDDNQRSSFNKISACIDLNRVEHNNKRKRSTLRRNAKQTINVPKNLSSLKPIPLKVAFAQYLICLAKKWRSDYQCRQYSASHLTNLPVTLTKKLNTSTSWKLKLAKHKLRWREVDAWDGSVYVFPESYSAPDNISLHKPPVFCSVLQSMSCVRGRQFYGICKKKKKPRVPDKYATINVTSRNKKSFNLTETSNSTFDKVQPGVMVVRLYSKSYHYNMVVKILSSCKWGEKAEEIFNVIIENHNELQRMQRGKYIQTTVDEYLVEVLRVQNNQIITDTLPYNIRKQLQISCSQTVSLVKISLSSPDSNSEKMEEHINFGHVIHKLLQLDKEMSQGLSKDANHYDVKDVMVEVRDADDDDDDAGESISQRKPTKQKEAEESREPDIMSKEGVVITSKNLQKMFVKALNQQSTHGVKAKSQQKEKPHLYDVGRIGCLNKVTSTLRPPVASEPNATVVQDNLVNVQPETSKSMVDEPQTLPNAVAQPALTVKDPVSINQPVGRKPVVVSFKNDISKQTTSCAGVPQRFQVPFSCPNAFMSAGKVTLLPMHQHAFSVAKEIPAVSFSRVPIPGQISPTLNSKYVQTAPDQLRVMYVPFYDSAHGMQRNYLKIFPKPSPPKKIDQERNNLTKVLEQVSQQDRNKKFKSFVAVPVKLVPVSSTSSPSLKVAARPVLQPGEAVQVRFPKNVQLKVFPSKKTPVPGDSDSRVDGFVNTHSPKYLPRKPRYSYKLINNVGAMTKQMQESISKHTSSNGAVEPNIDLISQQKNKSIPDGGKRKLPSYAFTAKASVSPSVHKHSSQMNCPIIQSSTSCVFSTLHGQQVHTSIASSENLSAATKLIKTSESSSSASQVRVLFDRTPPRARAEASTSQTSDSFRIRDATTKVTNSPLISSSTASTPAISSRILPDSSSTVVNPAHVSVTLSSGTLASNRVSCSSSTSNRSQLVLKKLPSENVGCHGSKPASEQLPRSSNLPRIDAPISNVTYVNISKEAEDVDCNISSHNPTASNNDSSLRDDDSETKQPAASKMSSQQTDNVSKPACADANSEKVRDGDVSNIDDAIENDRKPACGQWHHTSIKSSIETEDENQFRDDDSRPRLHKLPTKIQNKCDSLQAAETGDRSVEKPVESWLKVRSGGHPLPNRDNNITKPASSVRKHAVNAIVVETKPSRGKLCIQSDLPPCTSSALNQRATCDAAILFDSSGYFSNSLSSEDSTVSSNTEDYDSDDIDIVELDDEAKKIKDVLVEGVKQENESGCFAREDFEELVGQHLYQRESKDVGYVENVNAERSSLHNHQTKENHSEKLRRKRIKSGLEELHRSLRKQPSKSVRAIVEQAVIECEELRREAASLINLKKTLLNKRKRLEENLKWLTNRQVTVAVTHIPAAALTIDSSKYVEFEQDELIVD